ncbi:MAG: PIN domain-containing protein, partial [Luteolibacter sp.]
MSEALDTNVLVRLATRDDAAQFKKAGKLVRGKFSHSSPAWINVIVVVEYSWVLARLYQYDRKEIATTLTALLAVDCFRVENQNLVRSAIQLYTETKADFSDCLILVRNQSNGAESTYT